MVVADGLVPIWRSIWVCRSANVKKPRTFNCIPGMRSVNERRRYNVTSSLIGWAHTQNDPWKPGDVMMLTLSSLATPVCRNDKLRFLHWRPSWYRDNPWVSVKELRTDLPQVRLQTNNQISLFVRTWRIAERNVLGASVQSSKPTSERRNNQPVTGCAMPFEKPL